MLGIEHFSLFLGAGIMLNLYPGPDTLYILGRSVSQGRMAGIAAVLGISTGALIHTLLGAFGLSALLVAMPRAFFGIQIAGGCYLLYQAVLMIGESFHSGENERQAVGQARFLDIYRQGVITNVLNPKVALFFLAFLPQFISPQAPSKTLSFMALGAVFLTTGTLWCLAVAWCASFFSLRLRRHNRMSRWLLRTNGLLFAALGFRLLLTK